MEWEGHTGFHNGGNKMGPIVPHFGVHFCSNHKSEHEITAHENIVYEKDVNIASRAVFSVNDKKLSEA